MRQRQIKIMSNNNVWLQQTQQILQIWADTVDAADAEDMANTADADTSRYGKRSRRRHQQTIIQLTDLRKCADTRLDMVLLWPCQPFWVRQPVSALQQLDKHRLPRLHRRRLLGEAWVEKCRYDWHDDIADIVLQHLVPDGTEYECQGHAAEG